MFITQILNVKNKNKNTEYFGVFLMNELTKISVDINLKFVYLAFIFKTVFEMF